MFFGKKTHEEKLWEKYQREMDEILLRNNSKLLGASDPMIVLENMNNF